MAEASSWLTGGTFGDLDIVRAYWPSVDEVPEDALPLLLASAKDQCAAYATTLAEGEDVPNRYRHAQVLQAKALWRSSNAGTDGNLGADGMTVTVFPMDWTVKRLLRPQRGVPHVG